jgi:hypothetical protein
MASNLSSSQASTEAQETQLLGFINYVLARRNLPRVTDLREDLSSGVVLITVIDRELGVRVGAEYESV